MCLQPGDTIRGRYQIERKLEKGGFGETYVANDNDFLPNHRCVVKLLQPQSTDPTVLQEAPRLFTEEAKALAILGKEHDQIPNLLAYFEENSKFYLVQEYIEGDDLRKELQDDKTFSEKAVINLLQSILEIVEFVHQKKTIHLDIKPSNLIRREKDGKIVLIDFGSVKKIINLEATSPGQRKFTFCPGTEGYMAPEQKLGFPADYSTDIYSVGMIGVQALTGKHPSEINLRKREGDKKINWPNSVKVNIKSNLLKVIDKMVCDDFRQRYQSATEVLQALESLQKSPKQKLLRQSSLIINQLSSSIKQLVSKRALIENVPRRILPILLGIVTFIIILNYQTKSDDIPVANNSPPTPTYTTPTPSTPNPAVPIPLEKFNTTLQDRISFGEKILFKQPEIRAEEPSYQGFQAEKESGVKAMVTGNYQQAISHFEEAIKKYSNAPETLIYLNNARIGKQKAYTIAVPVPIGTDPNQALEVLRGVAQAQNEINDRTKKDWGIKGVPLKVAIANDDNNPGIAKQIASTLVNNRDVIGVVGHYSSDATKSAGEEYDKGKLVTISPASTDFKLSGFSLYLFRTVPNDAITAKALANYMLTKLQKKKAAVFFNSKSEYSKSFKTQFIEEVAANLGKVDKDLEFDLSDSSFSARKSVEKAIERGTQVLMLAPNVDELDKALLVVQANKRRLKLMGGDAVYSGKTREDGGEAAVGMVVAVAWHIDADPRSDFVRNSRQLWDGSRVSWRTAMSYDATQALIAALKRNPTRQGIKQALSASDFSATGASGTIQFLSSGDRRERTIQLVEVCPGKRPGTDPDFVPVGLNCKV